MNGAIPVLFAAMLVAAPAHATVFKCLLDDGRVFYQDAPCAPGRELRDFDKDPANVSVVPFTQPTPPARTRSPSAKDKAAKPPAAPRSEAKPKKPVEPVGDPKQRKFLRPGMSEGEVVARVGPPDMTSSRNRKGQRWTYMPVPEDRNTITNLQFDKGRLVEIERKVIR
jgi:hypothetical protein